MKMITILASVALLFATVTSCSKESLNQQTSYNQPSFDPIPGPGDVKMASSWFSLSLDSVNTRSNPYLIGRYDFESNLQYDRSTHVELAYVKIPGQRINEIKKLPFKYSYPATTQDKMCSLNFSMEMSGFVLTVLNIKPPYEFADASEFTSFRYRYIVIPKTLYEGLNIDWDDYAAVAHALNI